MSDQENTPQENEKDEVEGHLLNQTSADQASVEKPDVEGHSYTSDSTTADEPDVEGHMYTSDSTTVDQTNID